MSKNNIINNKNEKIIELLYSPEMVIETNASSSFICYSSAIDSENLDIDDLFINSILESGTNEKIIINPYEHVIEFLLKINGEGEVDWKIVFFNNHKDNYAKKITLSSLYAIYSVFKGNLVVLFFDFNEIFTGAIERLYLFWKEKEIISNRLLFLSEEMDLREVYDFIGSSFVSIGDSLKRFAYIHQEYGLIIDMIKRIIEYCEEKAALLQIKINKHMFETICVYSSRIN